MSTARHPNLESAFAAPSRGASLEGLLPSRPRPAAVEPAPRETGGTTPEPTTTAARSRTAARQATKRTPSPAARAGDDDREIHNVAVYLPPVTLDAARTETRRTAETYAELLARAFDAVDHDQLKALFQPRPTASGTGMPARPTRPRGAPGIQRQVRLSTEQRDWLDRQVDVFDAPSRSAFVAAVYGLHFGTLHTPPNRPDRTGKIER